MDKIIAKKKIDPVYLHPGDKFDITFTTKDGKSHYLKGNTITEYSIVDTVIVIKIENRFIFKIGYGDLFGEDDGN